MRSYLLAIRDASRSVVGSLTDFSSSQEKALYLLLWALFVPVAAHSLYYLAIGLFNPILDWHAFRQTQTAHSAYWAAREGFKLAYETPVLGYPWSIPFEFPLYQWLVAGLSYVGVPIDVGGRLINYGFFVACLWPLHILLKELALPRYTLPIIAILMFSSPLYLYWTRTVMIESCALFFAVLWLALLARLLRHPTVGGLAGTTVAGVVAALAKSTTFVGVGLVGGLLICDALARLAKSRDYQALIRFSVFVGAACAVPLVVGLAWVQFSDAVKVRNQLGALLTSSQLAAWNFGSWAQRMSAGLWQETILKRAVPDTLGMIVWIVIPLAGIFIANRRTAFFIAAGLFGFLVPFTVFTNLHVQHNYYQYANAVFLLLAVGLTIVGLIQKTYIKAALILLLLIVGSQLRFFHGAFVPVIYADFTQDDIYKMSLKVRELVGPKAGLLVLGEDWSSAVSYYSERKGLNLAEWFPAQLFQQVLADPNQFLGEKPLGGIVYCNHYKYGDKLHMVQAYMAGRVELARAGACGLFSAAQITR